MSNSPRFDPPLVRALAAELSALLAGRAAHAVPVFDGELAATLLLDRGQALRWDLHPERGWVRLLPRPEGMEGRAPDARVTRVVAVEDERLLRIELQEGNRFRGGSRALVIELHSNQWNALLVDAGDFRIVSVLRAREAGRRVLRPGEEYRPPEPRRRTGPRDEAAAWADWQAVLGPLPPSERRTALLQHFAWSSPLNAAALLGDAAESGAPAALEEAFVRWRSLARGEGAGAWMLETTRGAQPYPFPMAGIPSAPLESLLAGFEQLARDEVAAPARPDAGALLARARRRLAGARKRLERLHAEAPRAGEGERLRRQADLLLAHAGRVQPGASRVTVHDEEGRRLKLRVEPGVPAHEQAEKLYDDARRRTRAEARLPELLEKARAELARWEEGVAAAEAGEVPAWLEGTLARTEKRAPAPGAASGDRLPYRVYTTQGGLEVRVGRTSKDNDVLTFRHARPDDIWLHARQVAGSHVVLRWSGEGAPPARDLEEAAVLAAQHSKARSSGTVAVDWTRRKHVRKPRGAPPGRVKISLAKTLFVSPAQ